MSSGGATVSVGQRMRGVMERRGGERGRRMSVEVVTEIGRSEVEECCGFEGWTREQEAALQRAYLPFRRGHQCIFGRMSPK